MIKCVDAYDTRELRVQCTSNKGMDRSTKEHLTMCSNNKSISLTFERVLQQHVVMMWDIDQIKPLSVTVVLSLFTPSFRRSTASFASSFSPSEVWDQSVIWEKG